MMSKLMALMASAVMTGAAFSGVTTHFALDTRTGVHLVPAGSTLAVDYSPKYSTVKDVETVRVLTNGDVWFESDDGGTEYFTLGDTGLYQFTHQALANGGVVEEMSAFYAVAETGRVDIPDTWTAIPGGLFRNCDWLTSVAIPSSVTSIEWGAFYGCQGLASVYVDEGNAGRVRALLENSGFDCANVMLVEGGPTNYTVSFNAQGGLCSTSSRQCASGTTLGTLPTATRAGYEFLGWFPAGGSQVTAATVVTKNMTLYAQWVLPPDGGDVTWSYRVLDGKATVTGANSATGTITIPSALGGYPVTSIGDYALWNCERLTSVTIPSSVTSIGNRAFDNCSGLKSVTIPSSVTSIGEFAFSGCYGLTMVTIPPSVTSISDYAFCCCRGLTSVTIPSSVTSIGELAFSGCYGLTMVTIPPSVTSIGEDAFSGCCGLKSVTIPSRVTSIGEGAFVGCSALKSFTVAPENTVFSSQDGVLYNKAGTELVCCPGGKTGAMAIPFGVKSIGVGALAGCEGLTALSIPSSVTSIDEWAFEGCWSLKSFTVASENAAFSSQDGILFNKAKTKVICCPGGRTGTVSIPPGVKSIGSFAFAECKGLTSVMIPSGVTSIGTRAFTGCDGLTSMTIPTGVKHIENGTFAWCTKLKSVTIPLGVTSIGDGAFVGCSGLTSLTIPSSVTKIEAWAFPQCDGLTSVTIPSSVTSIGWGAFNSDVLAKIFVDRGDADRVKRLLQNSEYDVSGVEFIEVEIPPYDPWTESVIVNKKISISTGLKGYKASGLPKGLVYDTKTGKITGAATKVTASEGVVVKFTSCCAEPEELTLVVRKEEVAVGCEILAGGSLPAGVVGAAGGIPLQLETETGVKSVSVTKLPSGMKYDAKKGLITGTPTTAGSYTVVLSVTTKTGAKKTVKIPVTVEAMPTMASGTFSGFVSVDEDNLGTFKLTASSAGKLTAKVVTAAGTYSFSKTGWDSVADGVYSAKLKSSKGDVLTLVLDSTAAWDANQLLGSLTTAAVVQTKKTAAVPSRTYDVSAQRHAFGKTWYFTAAGDATAGWTLSYASRASAAKLTVSLKADGSTAVAGTLPGLKDAKGKALKISASGYANVGGMKDGAILADFAPVLTVNKVKTVLAITANLWFDRSDTHAEGVGQARLVR